MAKKKKQTLITSKNGEEEATKGIYDRHEWQAEEHQEAVANRWDGCG